MENSIIVIILAQLQLRKYEVEHKYHSMSAFVKRTQMGINRKQELDEIVKAIRSVDSLKKQQEMLDEQAE